MCNQCALHEFDFPYKEHLVHHTLHLFHLPGGSTVQSLPWDIRLKVAIGAARGLAFLHTSEKQVIYRDFKASNILLDGVNFFRNVINYQDYKRHIKGSN